MTGIALMTASIAGPLLHWISVAMIPGRTQLTRMPWG
jgi:hypothetical protein